MVGVLQVLSAWQVDMAVMVLPALFVQDPHLLANNCRRHYEIFNHSRCIAMGSLWYTLSVRVYPFTSPASFVSLSHTQSWAASLLLAFFFPRHTVARHGAARLLFLATF